MKVPRLSPTPSTSTNPLMERINMATAKKVGKESGCEEGPGQEGGSQEGSGQEGGGQEGGRQRRPAKKARPSGPNAAFMKAMTPSGFLAAIIGDQAAAAHRGHSRRSGSTSRRSDLQDKRQADDDQRRCQAEGNLQEGPGLDVRDDQARSTATELRALLAASGRGASREAGASHRLFSAGLRRACRRRPAADGPPSLRLRRRGPPGILHAFCIHSHRRQP